MIIVSETTEWVMKTFEAFIENGPHIGYNKTVKARNIDAAIRKFRRELAPREMFYDHNVLEIEEKTVDF